MRTKSRKTTKTVTVLGLKLVSAEELKRRVKRNKLKQKLRQAEAKRRQENEEEWKRERDAWHERQLDAYHRYGHLRPEDRPSWFREYDVTRMY